MVTNDSVSSILRRLKSVGVEICFSKLPFAERTPCFRLITDPMLKAFSVVLVFAVDLNKSLPFYHRLETKTTNVLLHQILLLFACAIQIAFLSQVPYEPFF
jgi:hypothetical protein